jgi:hypothetical protein
VDPNVEVGLAIASRSSVPVQVRVWYMTSPGDPDVKPTTEILTIKTLFCPVDTKRGRSGTMAGKVEQVSLNCSRCILDYCLVYLAEQGR